MAKNSLDLILWSADLLGFESRFRGSPQSEWANLSDPTIGSQNHPSP